MFMYKAQSTLEHRYGYQSLKHKSGNFTCIVSKIQQQQTS